MPPSPLTSIPNSVKCITIAPKITPIDSEAPIHTVLGMSNKIPAISSKHPMAIRP